MLGCTAPLNLARILEQHCERICKPQSAVLFRRGQQSFGIFLIFTGKVSLDLEMEDGFPRLYGPGALLGLPATLTKRTYAMTATVTADAELGFVSPQTLTTLMQENPSLCTELLALLSERMLEIQRLQKAVLQKEKRTSWDAPESGSLENRRAS